MKAATFSPTSRTPRVLPHCTGCGHCVAACRPHALSLETENPNGFGRKRARIDTARCSGCGECLPACPYQALIL
ncbi:hypothetical protein JCM30471_09420 [Desulfuromonas carbonis]|uniref:4Fe-4S dicluster domain-containing protein n=1 Tax=Desulfuromonas sp. DDH964 TaxID=1823759 RepID=UPI00078E49F1|nr:4Fe-4S dicluster domain-containing protein [Desulfuromonas sp. DDH964]AMV72427.1 iron-sulfur cluster-binding oxidoreductase [Desulfuromonas sp. DDH964]